MGKHQDYAVAAGGKMVGGLPSSSGDGGIHFMHDSSSVSGLSPLDQIRLFEAEITRKIITTRQASERSLAEARAQAALIKKHAHESGEHEGQIRYKAILSEAEEEAQAIVGHAHNRAAELHQRGSARMELAIQEAIRIVLGLKERHA
jgi:vacuolar-type H+-ATPase subunit H